jgi:hypothetical protein
MKSTLIFAAGFGVGWITRSTFNSSKSAAVHIVALGLDTVARLKRMVAIEREELEDIVAEAHHAVARRRAERAEKGTQTAPVEHAA